MGQTLSRSWDRFWRICPVHGDTVSSLLYVSLLLSLLYRIRMSTDGGKQGHENDDFRRRFTFPEEDRRWLTTAPANGVRWFKSDNVIDLEAYRRRNAALEQTDGG